MIGLCHIRPLHSTPPFILFAFLLVIIPSQLLAVPIAEVCIRAATASLQFMSSLLPATQTNADNIDSVTPTVVENVKLPHFLFAFLAAPVDGLAFAEDEVGAAVLRWTKTNRT